MLQKRLLIGIIGAFLSAAIEVEKLSK